MATTQDSRLVRFMSSKIGAVLRSVFAKVEELPLSVMDFGAVGDFSHNDYAAFAAAYAAAPAGGTIVIPAPPKKYFLGSPVVDTGKKVLWLAYFDVSGNPEILRALPGTLRNGSSSISKGTSTDVGSVKITRDASYSGGTPGFVNSALRVESTAGAGATAFEWALTSVMHNYAAVGENVGIYGQGNRYSTGATFGGVFESCDMSFGQSPGTQVGAEIDVWANGADSLNQRVGVDVVIGNAQSIRTGTAGTPPSAHAGVRVGAFYGNATTGGRFKHAFLSSSTSENAFVHSDPAGLEVNQVLAVYSPYSVGIDLSQAACRTAAVRIPENAKFSFNRNDTICLQGCGESLACTIRGSTKLAVTPSGVEINNSLKLCGQGYGTGTGSAALSANRPGGSAVSTPATWMPVEIDGAKYWMPLWADA